MFATKIDDLFLNKFLDLIPPFGPIGYVTYKRTYARKNETGTEEWWQTCARVCNGLLKIGAAFTQEEIQELYTYMFNLKGTVGGRMLWQLGTETVDKIGGDSLINCWLVSPSEPIEPFKFTMNQLMLGGGVGFSILPEVVYKLPMIKHNPRIVRTTDHDVDFIVPDNREGWVELLGRVLESFFFSGKSLVYSTDCIRPKGAAIKGFGGTASGPEDLVKGIDQITKILSERHGRFLRPVDVLDIMNIIGQIVVAGNVRRSAELSLGDALDREYLYAKNWKRGAIPNWRAMSNNSVSASVFENVPEEFWNGYNGEGEPYGLVNLLNHQRYGRLVDGINYRPDYGVRGVNPCLTGDTWIMTFNGPRQIRAILGSKVDVYNDTDVEPTTEPGFFSSGVKQVFEIVTKEGYKIKATGDHRFFDGRHWSKVNDLRVSRKLLLNKHFGLKWEGKGTKEIGYILGLYVAEGTVGNTIDLYGEKKELLQVVNKILPDCNIWDGGKKLRITSNKLQKLVVEYGLQEKCLSKLHETSSDFHEGFIAGFFDGDGTVLTDSNKGASIRAGQVVLSRLEDVQQMLIRLGIFSTIYTERSEAGYREIPGGIYWCQAMNELCITKDNMRRFKDRIELKHPEKKRRVDYLNRNHDQYKCNFEVTIKQINLLEEEEVFDCQVPGSNRFSANGFVSHNCSEISLEPYECCNLAEIFLPNIQDVDEFKRVAKVLYMAQKSISAMHYSHPETRKVVQRNMRLGLGVTGYLQSEFKNDSDAFNSVYKFLEATDEYYSQILGVNKSVKLTTVKPSGTLSLLPGVTPGVHPAYSPYYTRNIRFASSDPLVEMCKERGYKVEPLLNLDGTSNLDTMVISFPVKTDERAECNADITAVQQLENLKFLQTYWADNSVSATIYYHQEELPSIKDWLKENYDSDVKSVSFLMHSGHGFKQAPYIPISVEEYHRQLDNVKPISNLSGHGSMESVECAGGACPVK